MKQIQGNYSFQVFSNPLYYETPNTVSYHYIYHFISASGGHIEINTLLKASSGSVYMRKQLQLSCGNKRLCLENK